MIPLEKFHDAGLKHIDVLWERGLVKFDIEIFVEGETLLISLIGEGFTSLTIPKFDPWGPSDSINKIWEENSGEATVISIEMQSGDLIEARVANYLIQPLTPLKLKSVKNP